jgi:hypothetical protein
LTISKKNLRPVLAFLWLLACRCWPRLPQCEEEWQTVAVRYQFCFQLQRQRGCWGVFGVATSLRYSKVRRLCSIPDSPKPKARKWLWVRPCLLGGVDPGYGDQGVKLNTHLYLLLRLIMSGIIQLFIHINSWHAPGKVYFLVFPRSRVFFFSKDQ